jgi:hypothetical protein
MLPPKKKASKRKLANMNTLEARRLVYIPKKTLDASTVLVY